MADSQVRLVLEAAHLAAEADLQGLRDLVGRHGDALKLELVLRVLLTYLPESVEPFLYVGLLQDLASGKLSPLDEPLPKSPLEKRLSDQDVENKARRLHLLALGHPLYLPEGTVDVMTRFLISRAHRIDAESGSILYVGQLLQPFLEHSEILSTWIATVIVPKLRLEYEHLPPELSEYTLRGFEELRGPSGVMALLADIFSRNNGFEQEQYVRDLRGVLGPWIYGQGWREQCRLRGGENHPSSSPPGDEYSISLWATVNKWLLERASDDPQNTISVLQRWGGPQDIEFGGLIGLEVVNGWANATISYAQCLLATLYLPIRDTSGRAFEQRREILQRASVITSIDLEIPDKDVSCQQIVSTLSSDFVTSITNHNLLHIRLLESSNPVTAPSSQSLELAALLLISARLLESLGEPLPPDAALYLMLCGFEADQRVRLQKVLRGLLSRDFAADYTWTEIREKLQWLRRWNTASPGPRISRQGVFCLLESDEIEVEVLKASVTAGQYRFVIDTYVLQPENLPRERVENSILEVAFSLYDNASNGNKTRGSIKKAFDIIQTFCKEFPQSLAFRQANALIQATHMLSFYSLTLQHGVACLPVNIRAQANPLSLIDKVLAQNPRSYTKLDDLIDIGLNFFHAGLIVFAQEEFRTRIGGNDGGALLVERQVIGKTIAAALAENDFDTAYSYTVSRLSLPDNAQISQSSGDLSASSSEDILWKAAYEAGRYQPTRNNGPTQLRRIEQRMELLSKTLLLAPSSALVEILSTWRSCEQDMNASLSLEREAEERWNYKGDRRIPGGFTGDDIVPTPHTPREATRKAMNEGAPIGLFDVARGAAAALSKSAFPLRASGSDRQFLNTSNHSSGGVEQPNSADDNGEGRIRKRDMVSGMVTGGLASGIGWVLGAPPVRND